MAFLDMVGWVIIEIIGLTNVAARLFKEVAQKELSGKVPDVPPEDGVFGESIGTSEVDTVDNMINLRRDTTSARMVCETTWRYQSFRRDKGVIKVNPVDGSL